jgi:hypothetical protein
MSSTDYSETIVDCPSLGLRGVSLRTVERILQDDYQTLESFSFVLRCDSSGKLTVTDSVPIGRPVERTRFSCSGPGLTLRSTGPAQISLPHNHGPTFHRSGAALPRDASP